MRGGFPFSEFCFFVFPATGDGQEGKSDLSERGGNDLPLFADARRVVCVRGERNHPAAQFIIPRKDIRVGDKGAARRLAARVRL